MAWQMWALLLASSSSLGRPIGAPRVFNSKYLWSRSQCYCLLCVLADVGWTISEIATLFFGCALCVSFVCYLPLFVRYIAQSNNEEQAERLHQAKRICLQWLSPPWKRFRRCACFWWPLLIATWPIQCPNLSEAPSFLRLSMLPQPLLPFLPFSLGQTNFRVNAPNRFQIASKSVWHDRVNILMEDLHIIWLSYNHVQHTYLCTYDVRT